MVVPLASLINNAAFTSLPLPVAKVATETLRLPEKDWLPDS